MLRNFRNRKFLRFAQAILNENRAAMLAVYVDDKHHNDHEGQEVR